MIHLHLLQLPDVAFTHADHLPHLALVFLLLMQPLRLLPLLLLLRKLKRDKETELLNSYLYAQIRRERTRRYSYLFDLVSVL